MTDHSIDKRLEKAMEEEVKTLRDVLTSVLDEQQAILANRTEDVRQSLGKRDRLLETIERLKQRRMLLIEELRHSVGNRYDAHNEGSEMQDLLTLLHLYADDHPQISKLRDEVIQILQEVQVQTSRNSFLLKKKVDTTKTMLDELQPKTDHKTYSSDGSCKANAKRSNITLINREG